MANHPHKGGVIVILIDDRTDGFVLVANPTRPGSQPLLKFSSGNIEPGDADPEAAAHRKVLEETGLPMKKTWHLGTKTQGGLREHLYVATVDFSRKTRKSARLLSSNEKTFYGSDFFFSKHNTVIDMARIIAHA